MDNQWSYVCCSNTEGQDEFVAHFLESARVRELPAKTYLVRQGERGENLHLLMKGIMENCVFLEDGRKKTNLLYTGRSMLGIVSLDEDVSGVNLKCVTRCEVASVHRSIVQGWGADMLFPIAMCQTYKMQGVYRQLRDQVFLSTEDQVVKLLGDLERGGALCGVCGDYKMKRISGQMIADILGVSRVMVSNILSRIQERQLFEIDGDGILFS